MEMLEHVPDPSAIIKACQQLVKPDGHVFFSTINRNPKSYVFAIVGAEYMLQLLPKGTHDYKKFIRPSELATWIRAANLTLKKVQAYIIIPSPNIIGLRLMLMLIIWFIRELQDE
jgi:2-polyprenyl-6-hydroxyphenyl methylase/3-demethylubiquinone-9 3-methyltransferase